MTTHKLGPRSQGDWYCLLDGERLPVGHHWFIDRQDPTRYFDPCEAGWVSSRWAQWIRDVMSSGRMVIQVSVRGPDVDRYGREIVRCSGEYRGLFKVIEPSLDKKNKFFSCRIEKIGEVSHERADD